MKRFTISADQKAKDAMIMIKPEYIEKYINYYYY